MPPQTDLQEFDLINQYFRPIAAASPFSCGLQDDAAHIPIEALKGGLIVSCDTLVAGVHFLPSDPPDSIAQKALRVNLSDLAAKGASPVGALLALSFNPADMDAGWLAAFARGLAEDTQAFACPLLGGDTTTTPGPLTISVTILGQGQGASLLRSGGQAGDVLCCSGAIGWGHWGLKAALGQTLEGLSASQQAQALEHYRRPQPQLVLGTALARTPGVHASMDISDGLLADARKLAQASKLAAHLRLDAIPLAVGDGESALAQLSAGDDYQVLFACTPGAYLRLKQDFPHISQIGQLETGEGLRLLGRQGEPIALDKEGYVHGAA